MILHIFKIGGSIVDNKSWLDEFARTLSGMDSPSIVVHGGGKTASEMSERLGLQVQMHEGRRITDQATLEVIIMTYAGLINKQIVARLQQEQINAIGLTGADANTILAHKRTNTTIDYGFAGDIDQVNTACLESLIGQGLTPVMAPLTHDGNGQLLNTNADTIAASLAGALSGTYEVRLVYLLDHPGVMKNMQDPASVIKELRLSEIAGMKADGTISDGMLPKLHNASQALKRGVTGVWLANVRSIPDIAAGSGTRIVDL